ncbi:hypothetical protein [Streptomyces lydicus]|uniref:hypothetical protein n=1 Tax=Streptomyces lydicus TaxID=47763 RepID=UPI0037A425E2
MLLRAGGLEGWRDWLGLLEGDGPRLGHDPSPAIEVAEPVVRLWPDGGNEEGTASGPCLEIPVGDLARILHTLSPCRCTAGAGRSGGVFSLR